MGVGKAVSVSGISISGTDASNYSLVSPNAVASAVITARTLTVDATGVDKIYNGDAVATVTLSDNRVAGDSFNTSYSASFLDKDVAAGKAVSVSGLSISGTDAANYVLSSTTGTTTADITAIVTGAVSGIGGGVSMALSLNGGTPVTTTTEADGSFRFGGDLFVKTGDAMLVYVNDGSHNANLVGTIAAPANVTNLTLANGQVSVGSANAINIASSYTNANLSSAKGLLADNINYGVANNALAVSGADLYVPAGVTFTPGGDVAVTGDLNVAGRYTQNSNLGVGGDLNLSASGTLTDASPLSHAFTVSGNFSVPYGASFARFAGTGTANDPYLIQSVYDLQAMKNNLSSYFKLGASLDASSVASWNNNTGFDPIGDSLHAFTGSLNGNGKVISNLKVDRADTDYLGLFGNVGPSGSVSTLGLENISIYGHEYVGGLAGSNAGSLSNVYTTGVHTVSGVNFVGGLVGGNTGNIVNAYSSARTLGADKVGGLVGANTESGTIQKTYAMGYVTGTSNAGGLVGANTSTAANSVSDSFWNVGSTGRSARGGVTEGTGVSSVEGVNAMMNQGTYSGWDFATTWVMDNSGTYPHFQFRYPEGVRGVGGVVYINSTLNDVTTQSKAGAGNAVSVYSAATETDSGTYLDSTATGADSSYYAVLGKNAVGSTNYVVGVSSIPNFSDGSTRKLAGSGSVYPLNIWASENHTIAIPVMPDTPPIVNPADGGNNGVNAALIIPPSTVTPPTVTTIPTVTIVDQTGTGNTTQNFSDFSNLIGGLPSVPVTNPIVIPQPVTPPVSAPSQSPEVSPTPQNHTEDALSEANVSFVTEPPPGREPVPVKSEGEASSSGSVGIKSSESKGSAETPASDGKGSSETKSSDEKGAVKKESSNEKSEASSEKEVAAPSKSDVKAANWRDVPIAGFAGNEDAKKFLTDVRVIEGAVYVIDGGNAMSLLGMGDSMRVFYKRRKTLNAEKKATAEAEALKSQISDLKSPVPSEPAMKQALSKIMEKVAAEPEVAPAPEARVLKSATPIVMQQTKSGDRYGTLKNPGKDVFVRTRGGDWKAATDGMMILPGDEVKTAAKNSVEVLMDGGKIGHVEIKEGSLFRIQQAESDPTTGAKTTILDLAIGKILVKVEALKGNGKFEVRTPTALTGVRGTIFEVTVKEKA